MIRRSKRGFSLIEVVVAMAILAISFTAFMSGMSTALSITTDLEAHGRRMDLARSKLVEIDLLPTPFVGDLAVGQFGDGTVWRIEAFPFIAAQPGASSRSIVRIALTLEWTGNSGPRTWTASTYRVLEPGRREPLPMEGLLDALQ